MPKEAKLVQEQANQMVISWNGTSLEELPASDNRASVYDVELPTKESIRLLTWNIGQTNSLHLAFPNLEDKLRNESQVKELQKKIIAEKLKQSLEQTVPPLIITLQEVSRQEDDPTSDTLSIILNALNDGIASEEGWKARRCRGLVTLFDSSQVSCLSVQDRTPSRNGIFEKNATLVTDFAFNSNPNSCFNVVNIHRVDNPTQAANELMDHLLELDNCAPDGQTTIIIGDTTHYVPMSTNGIFYNPTAACLPNFNFINKPPKHYLRVDVPQAANICMVHQEGAAKYQVRIPSHLLGQTRGQDYLPVKCLTPEELSQSANRALKHMIGTYSNQLVSQIKAWKKYWEKNSELMDFLTQLEAAIEDEEALEELIASRHIVSNEAFPLPSMSNISLFNTDGPTAQEIEIALNREYNQDQRDDKHISVKVDTVRVGRLSLTITSWVLLGVGFERYNTSQHPPYTYHVNNEAFLTKIQFSPRDKIAFSKINLLNYLKMIHVKPFKNSSQDDLFEDLERAVDSYTETAYQYLDAITNNNPELLLELDKDLLLKEKLVLDKAIPIAKQDESKAAALYRAIRIVLSTLWEYLQQPLKYMLGSASLAAASGASIGMGVGVATGSVALPLIGTGVGGLGGAAVGAAAGGMVGGGLGFFAGFYKAKKYSECREEASLRLLRDELKAHKILNRFFIKPQGSRLLEDSPESADEETLDFEDTVYSS